MSVWTGKELVVFGRAHTNPPWSHVPAAQYNSAAGTWRKLTPFPGDKGSYEGHYSAVWTGKEALIFGPFDFQAFNPRTNTRRRLPRSLPAEFALGLVVWTGREAIAWGGGCCGDASSTGWAYNPTGKIRKLARSPLAPSQGPMGAWTGRELIVFVSGLDPDGKPYAASFARAAAYNPATNTWHRIAALPAPRDGATVVWDGHEALVVGGTARRRTAPPWPLARIGFGYNPAANSWRQLAPHGVRTRELRGGVDGDPTARLGREGSRLGTTAPTARVRLSPSGEPMVSTPAGAASGAPRPDRGLDGSRDDRLGGVPGNIYRGFADGATFSPATR